MAMNERCNQKFLKRTPFLGFREVFFCSTFETIHLFQSFLFVCVPNAEERGEVNAVSKSELERFRHHRLALGNKKDRRRRVLCARACV